MVKHEKITEQFLVTFCIFIRGLDCEKKELAERGRPRKGRMRAGDRRSVVDGSVQVRGWAARCLKHGLDGHQAQSVEGAG